MPAPLEECIFCERVHRGVCAEDKPKPQPKKRLPKTPPPQGSLPEKVASEPSSVGSGPAAGGIAPWLEVVANQLTPEQAALQALAGILHPTELEKHGLRRPSRPQINARIAAWKERRRHAS